MKHRGFGILAAAMLFCIQSAPLSVSAEESVPDTPEIIEPIYPPDQPAACELNFIFASDIQTMEVKVYQSTPERKDLLYAEAQYELAENGKSARVMLEPGEYSVVVSSRLLAENSVRQETVVSFQIQDPDETYTPDYTYYNITMSESELKDTVSIDSLVRSTDKRTHQDGTVTVYYTLPLGYYNRVRGDYSGDGQVKSIDSMKTLIAAADARAGYDTPDLTPGKLAAVDIDHNGKPDIKDAQTILRYYGDSIADLNPTWPD